MTTQSNISGDRNIIIKDINESNISIVINGDVREIRNDLSELMRIIREVHVMSIQYAEKVYNVANLNEENFNFIAGKKAFNGDLTKTLIEAIAPYTNAAREFLNTTANIPDWQNQARFGDKAKQIISCSFVGVIGIQLRKLMAIGKEPLNDNKQHNYIDKCIDIAKYSLDLLSIVLLSRLWDEHRAMARPFSEPEINALRRFFDNIVEPSIHERYAFLQTLDGIFSNGANQLSHPFIEWPDFSSALITGSEFHQSCQKLADLSERLEKKQYNLIDCHDAERQLGIFLQNLSFLSTYCMASIRYIGYRQPRNTDACYLHRYTALGIDNKANVDAEKINCTPETAHTDAILLYRGNRYNEYINLSPFVIDFNALTFEKGAKICFYHCKNFHGEALEYVFLEDNNKVIVEKKGLLRESDLNEIMMQEEKQAEFNLDGIFDLFRDARRCLLEGNK